MILFKNIIRTKKKSKNISIFQYCRLLHLLFFQLFRTKNKIFTNN